MNLHEYQAKELLRAAGVPIPPGEIATTPEQAEAIAQRYGAAVMVKAQVHAGGRGKAGGVKFCPTPEAAKEKATAILGMTIKDLTVEKVLVTVAADIGSEAYVGIIVDRATKKPVFMVSAAGGIDIEEVAASTPELILYHPVDTRYGLLSFEAMRMGFFLFKDVKLARQAAKIMQQLYTAFMNAGCSLAEINPLILRPDGGVHALDAKVSLDNNAGYRHPEWEEFRATEELDEREQLARTHDLQYIGLDGTVGIIANGAGLAMSTLDVVNQVGGTAANFLDIGGGANADMMAAALGVINSDENVKSIFINIFGGITRGEEVAKGIVEAMGRVELRAPIVIRLDGTNAEEGRQILLDAGIPESKLVSKPTMLEAARAAVALANGTN